MNEHAVGPSSGQRSLLAVIRGTLRASWRPTQISAPVIDPFLGELPVPGRITEVCRYKVLQLEYALSRGGGLRAWLGLNLLVGITVLIPAMLVVPILTWLLGSFVPLTAFLYQAAQNLMFAVLTIIVTVSAVLAFAYILKLLWKVHVANRSAWRRR